MSPAGDTSKSVVFAESRCSSSPMMDDSFQKAFDRFAQRKAQAAASAVLEKFQTEADRSSGSRMERIGSPFTEALLGPFYQSRVPSAELPALNLVFVQSLDGNTEAEDPSTLGGGETDKHVIYEGLSRAWADAVMAGAKTVGDGTIIFSVWHPELVAIRHALGKSRHPTQIVASLVGALPIESGLLFNVPEIRVIIVSAGRVAKNLAERCRSRPWIRVVSSGEEPSLRACAEQLRRDLGIARVSAVGGRGLATALISEGLVQDVYLTTSPSRGGVPNTPMNAGQRWVDDDLLVRKRSAAGVVFEHFIFPPR